MPRLAMGACQATFKRINARIGLHPRRSFTRLRLPLVRSYVPTMSCSLNFNACFTPQSVYMITNNLPENPVHRLHSHIPASLILLQSAQRTIAYAPMCQHETRHKFDMHGDSICQPFLSSWVLNCAYEASDDQRLTAECEL